MSKRKRLDSILRGAFSGPSVICESGAPDGANCATPDTAATGLCVPSQ